MNGLAFGNVSSRKLGTLQTSLIITYLVGQLRGEALDTVKEIIPSELNYGALEETLKENFSLPRRIILKPTLFAASILQFYNSVMGDIRSLEALNVNVAACAPFIIPIIEEKLPVKAQSAIGDCGEESFFNLQLFVGNFKKFLAKEEESKVLQPVARHEICKPPSITSTLVAFSDLRCQFCTGPHNTQSASEKRATIIRKRLCFNCLGSGQSASQCNSRCCCSKCKGKHHISIHRMQIYQSNSNVQPPRNSSPSKSRTNAHVSVVKNESTSSEFTTRDTQTTSITPSQQIVTNCCSVSPVISTMFNVYEIDSYSHKPNSVVNVVHVSSNDETM